MDRWHSYDLSPATGDVSFRLLGHRNYVHGTSMLDALLTVAESQLPAPLSETDAIKSFRVIREFSGHAKALVVPTADAAGHPGIRDALCRLDLTTGSGAFSGFLLERDGAPPQTIGEYDSGDYVGGLKEQGAGAWRVEAGTVENRIDLIRSIIEAMRQIERRQRDDGRLDIMRWGYLTDFPLLSDAAAAETGYFDLSAAREMGQGDKQFSIRNITIPGLAGKNAPEMCFYNHFRDG